MILITLVRALFVVICDAEDYLSGSQATVSFEITNLKVSQSPVTYVECLFIRSALWSGEYVIL